jgi:uncharacterized protein YebE (UPF0316 family)
MTQLLTLFIVLSILNVILNTIKSIVTVKGSPLVASLVNGLTFFVYTYVIIFTNCELNMHLKAIITAVVNIIGVYVVKLIEEKARKDKLWKIEMTIPTQYTTAVDFDLAEIPHNYIKLSDKHTLFNFYCATQKETIKVKDIVNQYGAKYFISETKNF